MIKTTEITSVLMLTTAYPLRRDLQKRVVEPVRGNSSQLHLLLSDSIGWLLYNYQEIDCNGYRMQS